MKCLSLFSGIGGFDLACKQNNIEIIGACEIDNYASSIYSRHFPNVKMYQDATILNPKQLPDFDLICAGFPCQAFSIAGQRLGFGDARGTLFYEIARIAKARRPRYLLLENVKGLLSHEQGKTLLTICSVLDEIGYDLQWQVINSKRHVPQNRDRIYIVGHLRGTPRPKVFPLKNSTRINQDTRCQTQKQGERLQIAHTIDANYAKGGSTRTLIQTAHIGKNRMGQRIYSPNGISRTITANGGGQGAKTGLYDIPVRLDNTKTNGRRMKTPGENAFTLSTGGNLGITDGKSNIRKLTPLECERLQGFPDGWTEGISDTQRYKCLGNAVTVPVVQEIISHLNI